MSDNRKRPTQRLQHKKPAYDHVEVPREAHIRGKRYSFEEIAAMLNITRDRVRVEHNRAIRKLRLMIGDEELKELLSKIKEPYIYQTSNERVVSKQDHCV